MQEAEVARLDASAPSGRLSRTYRLFLQVVLGTLPAAAIGYLVVSGAPSLPAEQRWFQYSALGIALFVSALTAYLAWRCHVLDVEAESVPIDMDPPKKIPFEALFDGAPDAVIIADGDGRIVKANRKACGIFGFSEVDFSRLGMADLFLELEGWNALRQIAPAPGMVPSRLDSPALRRDGSSFPAEIDARPVEVDGNHWIIASIRDASESRKAAEHLTQSEQQFRDIFDHAPIGMALTDLDGRVVEANESLSKLLGYSHDELLGMSFLDITHPDDLDAHAFLFQQMAAGKLDTCRVERRYLHKDGTPAWTLLGVSLQRDTAGRPRRLLSQIVDIGAIKAAQEALAASEVRLKRVLEGSNDGFWDRHIPSGTTTFSPRWATMLGYDSTEIVPELGSWEKLVHPDDLPICRRILAEHLSGERDRYEAVYRMRHKTGHWVWILARGKAYEWDADGNPLRMAGTHTDVTVRQLTTEALRLRERTLKAVLEALPIGVWIADANGRITSANPAALAMGPGVRYRALAEGGKRTEDAWGKEGRTVPPHDWALAHAI
ncbi:MAG: PAS domain S-box protein, partial [Actinomycetota bacterium]